MAKMFKFRLDQLLDLRRMKENLAEREAAEARLAVQECNQVILDLMTNEDEAKREQREMQERSVDVGLLRMAGEYLAAMDRMLKREYQRLQGLVLVEIEKRRLLTEAHQGVRVLERLREKQGKLHLQGLDLEERKFLDEIARRTA